MKIRYWILCAFLFLFGGCMYEFLGGLRTHVFHGRIVDAETDRPLAGAVVTVIWARSSYLGYEPSPREFLSAQETVTDSVGNFTLQASSGLNWEPFSLRSEPWIVMYQPAYEPLVKYNFGRHGFETPGVLVDALKSGATVRLRKLRSEEIRKYADLGAVLLSLSPPFERIPNLTRAINAHKKMIGISP